MAVTAKLEDPAPSPTQVGSCPQWLQFLSAFGLAIICACGLIWLYPPSAFSYDGNVEHTIIDIALFGTLAVLLLCSLRLGLCFQDLASLRFLYTVPAVALLLYRVVLYVYHDWALFLLDLCPVAQCCFLWTMWFADTESTAEWKEALFMVLNGPVAGSTFLLGTQLAVHHPEAFMSFFLHAAPMWMTFPIRWQVRKHAWDAQLDKITFCSLIKAGMLRLYLPWCGLYAAFLAVQPWIPLVSNMITLYDYNVNGGKPLHRDWPFWKWTLAAWAYCLAHLIAAFLGMVFAALCFRYKPVHVVFSACITGTSLLRALFSYFEMYPSGLEQMKIGALEMLGACSVAGVTALICWYDSTKNPDRDLLNVEYVADDEVASQYSEIDHDKMLAA
mmetsp:Transcript_123852/g.246432  ORF Transcript_123852/g.246432 Transcript_123852/m.246432 type:complete len:387 (+) Transcript_123852:48-1208(+)|eukprot:CAMPEP_0172814758 /NCGR_PEP_ID=MMETSP1075-20121228/11398_1 /TAXON_ID=2916 /ORGANISM="Ceratium fusus, Strain PA161109" /LENGTH=386 /DNA_ID=CAMNT_0013654565 /DNA_START=38 /DNA_END=1198 /DNA_ORIENTATION=+